MRGDADVAIVGGGPVGLYLALALLEEGLRPRVYERSIEPWHRTSRSIGVHPPSLELFDEIGVTDAFLARAVRVRRGLAFGERGPVGDVSFDGLPGRHRYVATLEQWETESVLREALRERAPDALVPGSEVIAVRNDTGCATVCVRTRERGVAQASFDAVVGADGKRSVVRTAAGLSFEGATYEGEYAMADSPDATELGESAAVFLTSGGLVESFPLPRQRRRWVVRRDPTCEGAPATRDEISKVVATRARQRVPAETLTEPTAFRAEHRLARALSVGRIALAGDAAHIVSPIGGQGMNLGWLGARSLAAALASALPMHRDPTAALEKDAAQRRAVARTATRRAELNMWLGRPTAYSSMRGALVGTLLGLPTASLLARAFTMRSLELGL